MTSVNTVTGPIDISLLTPALHHEHVVIGFDGWQLDSSLDWDFDELSVTATERLRALADLGVRTIVDVTTIEMGRNPELLRRVSEGSGLNIVCATGLFAEGHGIPTHFKQMPAEQLADLYVREITVGIKKTGIKAGAIKVATGGRQITQLEERILKAAATAQKSTGVPIITHTSYGACGDEQIQLFLAEGVSPHKVVIGHCDVSTDLRYHLRILRRGCFVGFDRIGLEAFLPDDVRAAVLSSLIKLGHLSSLVVSMDASSRWLGHSQGGFAPDERDYLHLHTKFLPKLKEHGISDEQFNHMLTVNMLRLFGPNGETDRVTTGDSSAAQP
jgi:phosphotriesterase-related protein